MERALLVCLLCLQGGLLLDAVGCADKRTGCAGSEASGPRVQRIRRQLDSQNKKGKTSRPGAFSTSNITWDPEKLKYPPTIDAKRPLDQFSKQPKKPHQPVDDSVMETPVHQVLTERDRKHLPGNKKKPRRKARVGSLSLLSNKPDTPLQVSRVRRQLKNERKKNMAHRPGKESLIADISHPVQASRARRQLTKEKKKKPGHPGKYSLMGQSAPPSKVERTKRNSPSKKKNSKKLICS